MKIQNDFRKFFRIVGILALAVLAPLGRGLAAEKEKVILDTDMVELLDDGVAMMMLAQAPNIQLEGVTIVFGNTWVETGTAAAIRQLEGMGRKDIPVFMGVNEPTRKDRFAHMAEEKRLYGQNFDSHKGAAGYPRLPGSRYTGNGTTGNRNCSPGRRRQPISLSGPSGRILER